MMKGQNLPERLVMGALAGLAGTFLLQGLRTVSSETAPQTMPPLREDPGEFMVNRAEDLLPPDVRRSVPEGAEKAAGTALGAGYGMAFGALYAALRPEGGNPLAEGAALGLGCWAVGYLGWLPRLGLMPPLKEQRLGQVAGPVLSHIAYGVATAAVYHRMRGHSGERG